ncbi:hypothetical protein ALC62_01429 [Cyphomyrmex costatus]|uniref:Uncharacterized protein n=1 Tax=Cyphomyrmex costatus TaxID=456900 RepID=A0A195D5A9_9HYME|nr:hypothetical protein ALC62_01429 [Cyphomyrmex costatus]
MTMHDPRNVVRGLGCMVRGIEWARYSDSLKRSYRHERDKCPRQSEPEGGGRKRVAEFEPRGGPKVTNLCGQYDERSECERRVVPESGPYAITRPDFAPRIKKRTEEERLPEADSCRKEKQAAVKSGRIPEERVGKKRAPRRARASRRRKREEGDDTRKGRKKRQSANLHANDEAVLIIRRVSVGRDTTLSRKQKGGKEDAARGRRFGGWT